MNTSPSPAMASQAPILTNTELLCLALGWQGGTVHQVAEETGLDVSEIINGNRHSEAQEAFANGWFALRTCTLAFNRERNFPARRGQLGFWMGVAKAQELRLQGMAEITVEYEATKA
jgi:hypothetical protein